MINESERGNAVPPLWLLFDGDGKAPKTPAFSRSFLQEVEVTQSTLLLFVTAFFFLLELDATKGAGGRNVC